MLEGREIEVRTEFAVDPQQQVLVEGGREAERVVVGEEQIPLRLDEVGAEQEGIPGAQRVADFLQKTFRRRRIEVAYVGTQEEDQD